jgi:hypothetical protein
MNRSEHLTENQLNAYFGNSALAQEAKHEIGRHLLQCDFCLKRLPQPTAEHFWTALMTDENADDFVDERASLAACLRLIVQKLMQPKVFALSTAALAVVLFFSAFIWLNAAKSSEMEKEVAVNFETKEPQPVFNQTGDENINLPHEFPGNENSPSSPVSNQIVVRQETLEVKSVRPKQNTKIASSNDFKAKTQENMPQKENIVLTRGGKSQKCGEHPMIDFAAEKSDENVVLKWKKIPNAAKYHLYVSDDEEILVDEFESAEATSYVLKKPLDLLKTYKWKIVVTLENGETVVSNSQKFTVKDLRSDQKKSKRKEKSEIRCSEDK